MNDTAVSEPTDIRWTENGTEKQVRWQSENHTPPPKRVVVVDDRIKADAAYRLACEGTAMLWRGDYQNARHLLEAMARRIDRKPRKAGATPAETFHLHRQAQAQRAHTLGMLLLEFEPGHRLPLRRAPDVAAACTEVHGEADAPYVMSLRELLGLIGAHQWRIKGVDIPMLGARIHPHYGVFSPVRGEYIELVAQAPLPDTTLAFDIGTGSGVLAALLARRGVARVIATDQDPRALACARDNIQRLGYGDRVDVVEADLFPPGQAPLIVCNPPWLPVRANATIEQAVYDPGSRMLLGFLGGLAAHLAPGGEGWLILSDFAEHLGLRSRELLLSEIAKCGLKVVDKLDTKPQHPRASDPADPLYLARAAETTSLWRLAKR